MLLTCCKQFLVFRYIYRALYIQLLYINRHHRYHHYYYHQSQWVYIFVINYLWYFTSFFFFYFSIFWFGLVIISKSENNNFFFLSIHKLMEWEPYIFLYIYNFCCKCVTNICIQCAYRDADQVSTHQGSQKIGLLYIYTVTIFIHLCTLICVCRYYSIFFLFLLSSMYTWCVYKFAINIWC